MNSFIVLPEHLHHDRLTLVGDEAHHCARVLRMHAGEELLAIDGIGCGYRARIDHVAAATVECALLERLPGMNEPALRVTLAVSLLKQSSKFDILVEKCVELGVAAILPLIAAHAERTHGNLERWRGIATSAAKQSLRCVIPRIEEPRSVADACASGTFDALAIAHEKTPLQSSYAAFLAAHAAARTMLILIGPEGGFTEEECLAAERAGATRVSLGPRRLRTETSAVLCAGMATQPAG